MFSQDTHLYGRDLVWYNHKPRSRLTEQGPGAEEIQAELGREHEDLAGKLNPGQVERQRGRRQWQVGPHFGGS